MLNQNVTKLLNEQVNYEFYSAYFYLRIYAWYADKNLNGFANWFNVQAQEERDHAMLFVRYLINNSEPAELKDIKIAEDAFGGLDDPLRATLAHERKVTGLIHNIYGEALAVRDFRTTQFLDWFVKEQGEEEKNSDDLIKRYELFANDAKGLYLLDQELAARVYTPPTLVI